MSSDLSHAPWTEAEVTALERWQRSGFVHPYTCRKCRGRLSVERAVKVELGIAPSVDHDECRLVPTIDGWTCQTCDYTQNWCWAPSLGEWPTPWPAR